MAAMAGMGCGRRRGVGDCGWGRRGRGRVGGSCRVVAGGQVGWGGVAIVRDSGRDARPDRDRRCGES